MCSSKLSHWFQNYPNIKHVPFIAVLLITDSYDRNAIKRKEELGGLQEMAN